MGFANYKFYVVRREEAVAQYEVDLENLKAKYKVSCSLGSWVAPDLFNCTQQFKKNKTREALPNVRVMYTMHCLRPRTF